MSTNDYKESIKILHTIIAEPNEFKRYILLQMWISQLFSSTIIDPIKVHENRLKDTTSLTAELEAQSLYDVLRDVKTSLTIKNEELSKVLNKMELNMNIIRVLNKTLELSEDKSIYEYSSNIAKLRELIETNTKYIQQIQNLSESKFTEYINDN